MESISDVLSSTYTDSELKHVISVLDKESSSSSEKYAQRTIRTRVEHDLFARTKTMLQQMKPLAQSLQTLGQNVKNSGEIFNEMSKIISESEASTADFADNARYLRSESDSLTRQTNTLGAYMDAVYISDQEKEIINDVATELSPEFFTVLNRIKMIHTQSGQLLLAEAPINGEHLMMETSKILDQAYMRIKSTIDSELRQKARSQSGAAPPSNLRKYMYLLADRPLLFKGVLQEQSGLRQERLTREFSQFILTEQPNSRVMPVRYLGSVLAWVHAAIVNEFEHIGLLLDPDTPQEEESSTSEKSLEQLLSTSDTRKVIVELVDSVIASLETTLRQQINSAIVAQTDATTVDELQNVLMFYQHMLSKYEQPTLSSLLEQLTVNLDRQFTHLLGVNHLTWESRVDVALAILKTYDSGVYSDTKFSQDRMNEILDEPLKKELEDATPIHALNVLDLAVSRLAGYLVAQHKLDEYRRIQAEYEAKQIALEVREMEKQSRLTDFQVSSISEREFLNFFDEFLNIANIDLQDRLEKLNSPTLQNRIGSSAILEFVNAYEFTIKDIPSARPAEDVRCLLL